MQIFFKKIAIFSKIAKNTAVLRFYAVGQRPVFTSPAGRRILSPHKKKEKAVNRFGLPLLLKGCCLLHIIRWTE